VAEKFGIQSMGGWVQGGCLEDAGFAGRKVEGVLFFCRSEWLEKFGSRVVKKKNLKLHIVLCISKIWNSGWFNVQVTRKNLDDFYA
jgi:hypothetical protein